ncbi:hypothetical protein HDE_02097 [Halotydeus destructor]|nr:hypothetical protein HDE_02097 [Halotydeus destructor]
MSSCVASPIKFDLNDLQNKFEYAQSSGSNELYKFEAELSKMVNQLESSYLGSLTSIIDSEDYYCTVKAVESDLMLISTVHSYVNHIINNLN